MEIEITKENQNRWIATNAQTVEFTDPTEQYLQPHVLVYCNKQGISMQFYGRIFLSGKFGQYDAGIDRWTEGLEWKDIRAVFLIEDPVTIPALNT